MSTKDRSLINQFSNSLSRDRIRIYRADFSEENSYQDDGNDL